MCEHSVDRDYGQFTYKFLLDWITDISNKLNLHYIIKSNNQLWDVRALYKAIIITSFWEIVYSFNNPLIFIIHSFYPISVSFIPDYVIVHIYNLYESSE